MITDFKTTAIPMSLLGSILGQVHNELGHNGSYTYKILRDCTIGKASILQCTSI